jgi:hypothetical protein
MTGREALQQGPKAHEDRVERVPIAGRQRRHVTPKLLAPVTFHPE